MPPWSWWPTTRTKTVAKTGLIKDLTKSDILRLAFTTMDKAMVDRALKAFYERRSSPPHVEDWACMAAALVAAFDDLR